MRGSGEPHPLPCTSMLLLALLSVSVLLCSAQTAVAASPSQLVTFRPQSINVSLINPERGWYAYTQLSAYNGSLTGQLSSRELMSYRSSGISIIHRYFVLSDYTAHRSSIPRAFLSAMQQDFALLRACGVKAIIRFCYTMELTSPPYHEADTETVDSHIAQVRPLLASNLDVIAAVEGGWVGVWGETYYTSHYGDVGQVNSSNWRDRKRVLDSMLAAVAPRHFVAVRYVSQINAMYSSSPLTAADAYNLSYPASRVSLHDDCFLAPYEDEGTFRNDSDRDFLQANSAFTVMGGETCALNPPNSDCPSALKQLAAFHWSTHTALQALCAGCSCHWNAGARADSLLLYSAVIACRSYLDSTFDMDVINRWISGGCYDEISSRLGYRYGLLNASLPLSAANRDVVAFNLTVVNTGFAAAYSPRTVSLIAATDSVICKADLPPAVADPRFWLPSASVYRVNAAVLLPSTDVMPAGAYSLYLHLPDAAALLRNRPEFAIQLANEGGWDAGRGWNALGGQMAVKAAAPVCVACAYDATFSCAPAAGEPETATS